MKIFLVTDVYEIINCHSPLVHSSCDVLANCDTDDSVAANSLAHFVAIQNCWTHARPCI